MRDSKPVPASLREAVQVLPRRKLVVRMHELAAEMNRERGGRAEDFCGAGRQQSIARCIRRRDSVKSHAATLRGADVGLAVADECGVGSIDGKYFECADHHVGRRLESEQSVAPDDRID